MVDDTRPPFRQQFDHARDPYAARNALGITGTGGSGGGAPTDAEYIVAVDDPTLTNDRVLTNTATVTWDLATAGQVKANTTLPAGSYQPLDADLTAIAALSGTNTIYYRSAANTWSPVVISTGLAFSGGNLTASGGGNVNNAGTPTSGQYGRWTAATTIEGVAPATVLSDIGAASSANFPAGAWTAWTPTVASGGGALTSYTVNRARYIQAGKTITAHFDVTITNVGTGGGVLSITLPISASASGGGMAIGQETVLTGSVIGGSIAPSNSAMSLVNYVGGSPLATNGRYVGIAVYEGV